MHIFSVFLTDRSHHLYVGVWAVKVFRRLNFSLSKEDIEAVVNAEHMAIERVLKLMKYKVAIYHDSHILFKSCLNEGKFAVRLAL
jgi:hypothetical protein